VIEEHLIIRGLSENDIPFIVDSWINSYFGESDFTKTIRQSIFYKFHRLIVKAILKRPSVSIQVAADKEDPDVIFGYLVSENLPEYNVFHYIYVKRSFNGYGVAAKMINECPNGLTGAHATHQTRRAHKIFDELNLVFNPYLL